MNLDPVARRARRRIALRLLPFLFLMYVICYVDRANVSFANLRMSADLGFSDRIYGLGVGVFFIGYVLFEVPGAIVVERWSARKWLARIMITWGFATIVNGFVQTATQFYLARFFVGVAEASFFPGVIVYLTHWFAKEDRAKAIASFYAAVPSSAVIGSLIATWLLQVQWRGLSGWRWIFVVEGIPPILVGLFALFYLTDRPLQAGWLSEEERNWITHKLEGESVAKKKARNYTILEAFGDKQVLQLILGYFFALTAALSNTYWLPTFLKRLSGLSGPKVAMLAAFPGILGILAMLINGWHSDKTAERRWHTCFPLIFAGSSYLMLLSTSHNFPLAFLLFVLGGGIHYAYYPVFWSMPTMVLTESAAAACFGLINGIGQTGGFVGPYVVGYLNDKTGALLSSFAFIGICYLAAGGILSRVRMQAPESITSPEVEKSQIPATGI